MRGKLLKMFLLVQKIKLLQKNHFAARKAIEDVPPGSEDQVAAKRVKFVAGKSGETSAGKSGETSAGKATGKSAGTARGKSAGKAVGKSVGKGGGKERARNHMKHYIDFTHHHC
ncbi:unnamed protein product [Linum trigynum]|uniref:Uncharacterized protein n=1 Tax=Linum trigynum TaxID=586398 RepID=A0AAV2FKD6_9ROSI